MKNVKAKSSSKVILFGEHSVVYNRPALAIPYPSLKVEVSLQETQEPTFILDSLCYHGYLSNVPKSLKGIQALIEKTFDYLQEEMAYIYLSVQSEIPQQRGLGSSAAVATAIVRAIFAYFDVKLEEKVLLNFVDFSENIYHLNPSGLDARTIVSEKVTLYQKNWGFTHLNNIHLPEGFLLVDSGVLGETSDAVSIVSKKKKENPQLFTSMMDELEKAAMDGTEGLLHSNHDKVAKAMKRAHMALNSLGVGHSSLDHLSNKLYELGAEGVKISGAGLGGCLIALYKNHEEALAAQKAIRKEGYNAWSLDEEWFGDKNSSRLQQHRADQILG